MNDLDRSRHCTATRGLLRCTLHPGHSLTHPGGAHYDSIAGQGFNVEVQTEEATATMRNPPAQDGYGLPCEGRR